MVKIGDEYRISPQPRSKATVRRLVGLVLCAAFNVGAVEDQRAGVASTTPTLFPSRTPGCLAAIGDSMTQAFNANAACRFDDQPSFSWATNQTAFCGAGDKTYSISERASCATGAFSIVPTRSFAISGQSMTEGAAQATHAKAWARSQPAPRLVTVLLGHNDICQAGPDNVVDSCSFADKDPNNYCRTTTFDYEKNFRQMLDILVTIPRGQIGIVHPVRVSQLCNFAHDVIRTVLFVDTTCQGLWTNLRTVSDFVLGEGNGVCRSITEDCSQARIEDAYNTWLAYRKIVNRVVKQYNRYAAGATIPFSVKFGTGNVVRAKGVRIRTTNALGNYKIPFTNAAGNNMVSTCDCYHPSDDAQNQIAENVWNGVTCSPTTPCCDDSVVGDTTYNRALCVNTITDGVTRIKGLWKDE